MLRYSGWKHLGSVVTNQGYSDRVTTAIDASVKAMWYRLSRREDDYCIECSPDGITFSHMQMTECKWRAHDGQQPDTP